MVLVKVSGYFQVRKTLILIINQSSIEAMLRNRKINHTLPIPKPMIYLDRLTNQGNPHDQTNPRAMAKPIHRTPS